MENNFDAATVEVLDDQDQVIATGIVRGRTQKDLLAKARKFVRSIGKLNGKTYSAFTLIASNGQDLSE